MLISSFGHLICFIFQASSTLAPKQCGGGCQLAACALPLGAHSPRELGDEAALPGVGVPLECGAVGAGCGCWWGSPGSNPLLGSSVPSHHPKQSGSSCLHQCGAGQDPWVPSPVVGAVSSARGLGVKGQTALTWSTISSLP